ncbi:GNAT family N-acetyltransferase [Pseudalkalibacillus decolorationis]|uniref:GNAT family N-acetyltransferase n=1 Tax=Pseudalkalibacillus decolorationis TaxID=163879 RepID=UPI0027E25339|nr:GNAT family N-acetyltransferase [Pseudalkalibacillus decolorationis]
MTLTFPRLETERLILREITENDAKDIFSYLSDKEVMMYYGLSPFETHQDALDEIDWYKRIFTSKTGIRWGIAIKGTDKIIGSCGFLNWSKEHYRAEVDRASKGILEKGHYI